LAHVTETNNFPQPDRPLFLKLGGSLITDKSQPHTPRPEVIARLAAEIQAARAANPDLRLLLGHGSGSFGHVAAQKFSTQLGVQTPQAWLGFVEVWREANALNRIVMDALWQADLPAIALQPSAGISTRNRAVLEWNTEPVEQALAHGLIPVVHGDVIFDQGLGGTILSTESLFTYLARHLYPRRILLAGIEPGVWLDYPKCSKLAQSLNPADLTRLLPGLEGSAATDVTGGMVDKVQQSMALVEEIPELEVLIFSGLESGAVYNALRGANPGTLIFIDSHKNLD
jgi:isopentenyl phosphate kinase